MKKLYFLSLTILMSIFSFGQATELYFSKYGEGSSNNKFLEIYNGTGNPVDLAEYSVELYANGATTATNTLTFTAGTIIANGDVYVIRNSSATLAAITAASDISSSVCNFNGDDAVGLKRLGAVIDVIGAIGTDPGTAWPVAGTTDGTLNHTIIRKLSVCSPNAVNLSSFGTNTTDSEWTVYDIDGELGQLGSHTGCSTAPALSITSPANATIFNPSINSVNISLSVSNFVVANGSGQGHIHYTVNGGSVVMKYDTTPIALTSLTPGTYTIYVELVDNTHTPIVPAVNATVTFTIASYNVVADLAALRADVITNGAGRYYQVSSNPVVTFKRTTRNQKYIQDASAAIVIDDAAAVITTTMVAGDAISSLKGQSLLFNGLLELTPTENATVASSGNTVTPQVVTISDVIANLETYESELVQINGVTFDATATNFAVNTNTPLTAPTASVFRTVFTATEVDYIGTAIPTTTTNIIAFPGENTVAVPAPSVYFVARSLADLTLANQSFSIAGLTITPNPVNNGVFYINTDANAERTVTIFDVLGKQVLNVTTSNSEVNVSNLTAGVYLVQVVEEGKTATKKLVIR